MNTTRNTLLERVRDAGDSAAWEEFFALYAPLLEGYAGALGLPRADAEEIRDQCLAVVVERVPTFRYDRAKGSFKGWLHHIARGKVLDALRRSGVRRAREERPPTADLLELADERDGPDRTWELQWRAEHLRYALSEVRRSKEGPDRDLIDLLLEDGLDAAEIGARVGLNPNQVYKLRSRLVREVRAVLERLGEEP